MDDKPLLKALGDYMLYAAALTAFLLAVVYFSRSAWYTTRAGYTLLGWFLAGAGVLGLNAVTVFFAGDWPGRFGVRLVLYGALFLFNLSWLVRVIRLQNSARKNRNEGE